MTHLKKSRSKLRKRKTIRRKTYKGGAAALNTDEYVWLAKHILETIYIHIPPNLHQKNLMILQNKYVINLMILKITKLSEAFFFKLIHMQPLNWLRHYKNLE